MRPELPAGRTPSAAWTFSRHRGRLGRPRRPDLPFLQPALCREVSRRSRPLLGQRPRGGHAHADHARRASPGLPQPTPRPTPARCTRRSSAIGPGSCPICGMALEPMSRLGRRGRRSRAGRHEPPVLDLPGSHASRSWFSPWLRWFRACRFPDSSRAATLVWIQFALATPVVSGAGCRSSNGAGRPSSAEVSICSH